MFECNLVDDDATAAVYCVGGWILLRVDEGLYYQVLRTPLSSLDPS